MNMPVDLPHQIFGLARERGQIAIGEVVEITGANRNTVKKHLAALVESGQLVQTGAGRGTRYALSAPVDEQSPQDALADLKAALTTLKPAGEDGFEGLMAVVLGDIAGMGFRVAGGGSQHGKDGEAVAETSHIAFEAKLYTTTINPNEVLSKIPKIAEISGDSLDLWVLGATIPINPNLANTLLHQANANGFSTLVLDWPVTAFPPLAAALALASDATADFLQARLGGSVSAPGIRSALATIKSDHRYAAAATQLQRALTDASLGLAIALPANRRWLKRAFDDKEQARIAFGQPLAPGEQYHHPTLERSGLIRKVEERVFQAVGGDIVALLGDEGCGKSWLFAQGWLQSEEPPLTLVITPGNLREPVAYENAESVLIDQLVRQTGGDRNGGAAARWKRKLSHWRKNPATTRPRLVVLADGLNQRSDMNWPRWLSATAAILDETGGKLVFTTREQHFRERLKTALSRNVHTITVPEWSLPELDTVLAGKGIRRADLSDSVVKSLRNPRLLGIAYELLSTAQIERFQELSVSRLLFEHIRLSTRDSTLPESAAMFAHRLARHAREVFDRKLSQRGDDLLIFERAELGGSPHALTAQLQAVAGEKFFQPVPGSEALYALTDDGLTYALALSVQDALHQAHRSGGNLTERLAEIVEPISALDKTSEVLLAALVVAGVDENCPSEATAALIGAFVSLQNIDARDYNVFAPTTRMATAASMEALYELSVSGRHVANKEWLISALRQQRDIQPCWEVIVAHLNRWLRIYSLSAEMGARERHAGLHGTSMASEIAERKTKLEAKMQALSAEEADFVSTRMTRRDDIDTSVLSEDAFILMAGLPLAEFAESILAWCFGRALNASFRTPFDEFEFLVRFNRRDWRQTRDGLLEESAFLAKPAVSRVGKWALVYILRATGDEADAIQESAIVEGLMKDKPAFKGWRQVERYCDTDPCDPASTQPSNVDATAAKYLAIDLNALRQGMGMTAEDYFLEDARPGLARFRLETASAVQNQLSQDVLAREGFKYRQGVLGLEEHAALLPREAVEGFAAKAKELCVPYSRDDHETRDSWISSQYTLLLVLPHLSGDAQLSLLAELPPHGPSLLSLFDALVPASPENLERRLEDALRSADPHALPRILGFAQFSGTALTFRSREIIAELARSTDKKLRSFAFGVIASGEDAELVSEVAEGAWSAAALDPKEDHGEIWYGSSILIKAAEQGHLPADEVVSRIAPRRFGAAASRLGEPVFESIALRLDAAISKAWDVDLPFQPPAVEQRETLSDRSASKPPRKALLEQETTTDPEVAFKRLQETAEDHAARQRQGWQSFNQFEAFLTRERARIIVEETSSSAIAACFRARPELVLAWADAILAAPDSKMPLAHNAGLMIARILSGEDSGRAIRLFERLSGSKPIVRMTYGLAATTLEARSLWQSASGPDIDRLRAQRLDNARTDHELALETLTAMEASQDPFLEAYVNERIESGEPAIVARAIMVCGFRDVSSHAGSVLSRFAKTSGVVGKAAVAAQYAYKRNEWSRTWYRQMCKENLPEQFWRDSILFLKIVDGRVDVWRDELGVDGQLMKRFEPGLQHKIQKRINSWKTKRERTFLGNKAPQPVFLLND